MSTKEEIKHLIDDLPDKFLDELLNYLREIEKSKSHSIRFSRKNLDKIMLENDKLLKELAK
jgi:hypothetical protein